MAGQVRQCRNGRCTTPRVRRDGPALRRKRVSGRHQGGGRVRSAVVLIGVVRHVIDPQRLEERDREVRQRRQHRRGFHPLEQQQASLAPAAANFVRILASDKLPSQPTNEP